MKERKGILVVSFGTSHAATRTVTIDAIEQTIRSTFAEFPVYTAWTSRMIMKKLLRTNGEKILNVKEALEKMHQDGITDVYIQTTHVIPGVEFDLLKKDALEMSAFFSSIAFGMPLLSSTKDMRRTAYVLKEHFSDVLSSDPNSETALLLMGHGSEHFSNACYAAFDYLCKDLGLCNLYVGTVEAYPSLADVLRHLKKTPVTHVHLAPFMIVAGDHAANDMAGSESDSWINVLRSEGYTVSCHLKGLGEYPGIRQLFLDHLQVIL